MKKSKETLGLEATDESDSSLMFLARRGSDIKEYNGEKLGPVETQILDKLFWASRRAYFFREGKQLGLSESTEVNISPGEASSFADLVREGMTHTDGLYTPGSSLLRYILRPGTTVPSKSVSSIYSYPHVSFSSIEAAEQILPSIDAFANDASAQAAA